MSPRRNIYRGVYLQRGTGIGVVFSSIFRALVPWIKRGAGAILKSKAVQNLAKKAGKSALKAAGSYATDAVAKKLGDKIDVKQARKGLEAIINSATSSTSQEAAPSKPRGKKRVVALPGQAAVLPQKKKKKSKGSISLLDD